MKLSIDLSINCTYFQPNFGIAQYVIQTKCTKLGECLFLSPEVAFSRSEAAVDTRHALHLAMHHIVVELLIRGAGGIVADAAASQFAVYHRGVAPVMMHMLRFLDFHRR